MITIWNPKESHSDFKEQLSDDQAWKCLSKLDSWYSVMGLFDKFSKEILRFEIPENKYDEIDTIVKVTLR